MTQIFATVDNETNENTYAYVEESDTGHVSITLENGATSLTVTVDAAELAEELILASPAFATSISEISQRAILSVLGR